MTLLLHIEKVHHLLPPAWGIKSFQFCFHHAGVISIFKFIFFILLNFFIYMVISIPLFMAIILPTSIYLHVNHDHKIQTQSLFKKPFSAWRPGRNSIRKINHACRTDTMLYGSNDYTHISDDLLGELSNNWTLR